MTRLRRYKTILSPIVFTCKEHTLLLSCFPTDNRGGGFHQDPRKFLQKKVFQLHWETRDSRKISYIVECVGPQKQTITRDWFHLKSCNTSAQLAKNIKEEKKKKRNLRPLQFHHAKGLLSWGHHPLSTNGPAGVEPQQLKGQRERTMPGSSVYHWIHTEGQSWPWHCLLESRTENRETRKWQNGTVYMRENLVPNKELSVQHFGHNKVQQFQSIFFHTQSVLLFQYLSWMRERIHVIKNECNITMSCWFLFV